MVNRFVDCEKHYEMFIESPSFGTFKILIDCEDYALVKEFHWIIRKQNKKCFYVNAIPRTENGFVRVHLHRLITNCPEGMVVDHINHDTLDNRKQNLRVCTQSENMKNLQMYCSNTSGHRGISFHKTTQKWQASIQANMKQIHLGIHDKIENAISARLEAEAKYW